VVRADRLLVPRDGRISEWGTHADLMASGGYYRSLVELQMPTTTFGVAC
jgi:ABC-type multidrug transport system fused ATPase/permease subunit